MKMTSEERELLKRMDAGELDGMVGDMFQTDGGSTVWTIIKNGIPVRFKQGPGGKFFNGTTLIISKKPGNTGISRDIRTEFTTDLLLSD